MRTNKAEQFHLRFCPVSPLQDLRARSVRAAAYNGASAAVDFAVRILSTAILARLIAPNDFGLIMMVTAVTAIADQIRELGLSAATVQRPIVTHAEVSNLFWLNVGIGFALALLICALAPLIANFYKDPRALAITYLLSTNFIIGGLAVQHQALLTRQLKLGHTAAIRLAASVLSTVLAITLATAGWDYWALAWREVSRIVFITSGMLLCLRWVPSFPSRRTSIRSLVSFGANLTGSNILGSITAGADRFILGRFSGASSVGIYRQAFQLITAPTDQLLSPLYQVLQPALSRLQTDPARYRRFYLKSLLCICAITMPLSTFAAINSTEITLIVLGPKWMDCAPVILILSLGTFIRQAVGSSAIILITRGQGSRLLKLTAANNAILIAFMLIGAKWGVLGIAIAEVASTYILMPWRLHYSFQESPITMRIFFDTIWRPTLACLIMAAVLLLLKGTFGHAEALYSVSGLFLIAILSFLISWVTIPGGRSEFRELWQTLKFAFNRKAEANA